MRVPGGERAVDNLLRWADGNEWKSRREVVFEAHLGEFLEELELSPLELLERLGNHTQTVLSFIVEDFLSARFGDEEQHNVVDGYLKQRGWLEKPPATQYLRGLRDQVASLYEVQELAPGRSLTVRDLLCGGDPIKVNERHGSESLVQWDCIVARIVPIGRTLCFTSAVLHFPRELAEICMREFALQMKDLRKRFRTAAKKHGRTVEMGDDDLRAFLLAGPQGGPFFTECFVRWTLERLAAPLPELWNTDDEPLVVSTVRFPLQGAESEVRGALDGIEDLDRTDNRTDKGPAEWEWLDRRRSSAPGRGKASSPDPDVTGSLYLGDIEIADGALLLRVNSVERAERGRDLLASRLGPLLGSPLTSHEDPAEFAREASDRRSPRFDELDVPPDVIETVVHGHLEAHYRQVLDEAVPMLGNRTPRRAAKTKSGRAAVIDWLKGIENMEARTAAATGRRPMDTAWMWEELKIPRHGGKL